MKVGKVTYMVNGKKSTLRVRYMVTPWEKFCGLMFKKSSLPLLFVFKKNKELAIHSFFCRPFTAIWLDDTMNASKVLTVRHWHPHLSGKGRYLLEIPFKER